MDDFSRIYVSEPVTVVEQIGGHDVGFYADRDNGERIYVSWGSSLTIRTRDFDDPLSVATTAGER